MINSFFITKELNISNINEYIISASVHDLRRINDKEDKGHGKRASDWFIENESIFLNFLSNANTSQFNNIVESVAFHDIDYESIPKHIYESHMLAIDIIKAADALDRYIQPKEKWWPNTNYIKIKESHKLLSICRKITLDSERLILQGMHPEEAIFTIVYNLKA